jgi:hypothetical protein
MISAFAGLIALAARRRNNCFVDVWAVKLLDLMCDASAKLNLHFPGTNTMQIKVL